MNFKYLSKPILKHLDRDASDMETIGLEIAFQLKRIADLLENQRK